MENNLKPLSYLRDGDLDFLLNHHSTDYFADTNITEETILFYLDRGELRHQIEFLPYGLVMWLVESGYDITKD